MNRQTRLLATRLSMLISSLAGLPVSYAQQITSVAQEAPPMESSEEPPAGRIGVGPFKSGYAMIVRGNDNYYMNAQGETIRVLGNGVLGGENGKIVFEKDNKRGVLSATGTLIVPAMYDHIEMEYPQFWRLYQGSRQTFYLPDGSILPLFDEIGYLDGEYFDVKQDGSWHLYSKSKDKIVTKNAYEGFDFCGGCSIGAPYVYAKKDGKWGIISWEEETLVPFAFEHEHRFMRNDNWVQSFSQNGKRVIVHIPTQQVFDATDPETTLVSGMLVTRENGQFGAYNRTGERAIPFAYDVLTAPDTRAYPGYYGNYLIAQKADKTGVVTLAGTVALPVEYDDVAVYDDFFVAKEGAQRYLLRDGAPEPLITQENAEISYLNSAEYSSGNGGLSIFTVKQKAYYGLYFADPNRFYEPKFYKISLRQSPLVAEGEIIEAEKQGLKTLFNIDGEKVIPFDVQDYRPFEAKNKPWLAFKINGKWGLYDLEQRKEIVPPHYDQYFKLLDSAKQVVIQAFADGFSNIDLYDTQGKKLNDVPLNKIDPIDHRYYLLEKENEVGYAVLDVAQKAIEDLRYPYVATIQGTEKLLMISHNGIDGRLYDFKNKQELERWYNVYMFPVYVDDHEDSEHWLFYGFQEGYAKVQSKEGIGYINEEGKVMVPPKYPWARLYGKNHVLVSEHDDRDRRSLAYIIHINGKRVFPPEYEVDVMFYSAVEDVDLSDNVMLLKEDTDGRLRSGLGDLQTGKILIPAAYNELLISSVDSSYVILSKEVTEETEDKKRTNLKFGLAKVDGQMLFEPKFDTIYQSRFDRYKEDRKQTPFFPVLVEQDNKWRYLHEDGSYLPIEGDYIYEH